MTEQTAPCAPLTEAAPPETGGLTLAQALAAVLGHVRQLRTGQKLRVELDEHTVVEVVGITNTPGNLCLFLDLSFTPEAS